MNKIKAFVTLFLIIMVAVFAVQNTAVVEIQFLFWGFSAPRVFVVLALLIVGFLLGVLVSSLSSIKHSQK